MQISYILSNSTLFSQWMVQVGHPHLFQSPQYQPRYIWTYSHAGHHGILGTAPILWSAAPIRPSGGLLAPHSAVLYHRNCVGEGAVVTSQSKYKRKSRALLQSFFSAESTAEFAMSRFFPRPRWLCVFALLAFSIVLLTCAAEADIDTCPTLRQEEVAELRDKLRQAVCTNNLTSISAFQQKIKEKHGFPYSEYPGLRGG